MPHRLSSYQIQRTSKGKKTITAEHASNWIQPVFSLDCMIYQISKGRKKKRNEKALAPVTLPNIISQTLREENKTNGMRLCKESNSKEIFQSFSFFVFPNYRISFPTTRYKIQDNKVTTWINKIWINLHSLIQWDGTNSLQLLYIASTI